MLPIMVPGMITAAALFGIYRGLGLNGTLTGLIIRHTVTGRHFLQGRHGLDADIHGVLAARREAAARRQ